MDVHFSTGKDDWQTPADLFHEWHSRCLFDVDAAANEHNHLLPRWYGPGGEYRDALTAPWAKTDTHWLNPPYSRGLQPKFVSRAVKHALDGGTTVALLPARTDTLLFHQSIWNRHERGSYPWVRELHFLKGRIKFVGAPAAAPFPSMIVVFGL